MGTAFSANKLGVPHWASFCFKKKIARFLNCLNVAKIEGKKNAKLLDITDIGWTLSACYTWVITARDD